MSFRLLVVVGIVVSLLGILGCSKSSTAPTPVPKPPEVVPVAPGSPEVMTVPSSFVSFRDVVTGEELPLRARFVEVLPQPSVKIVGGPPSGCGPYSESCFQWKIELCSGEGAVSANAQVHLSPHEGEKGVSFGGLGVGGLEKGYGHGCVIEGGMAQQTPTGGLMFSPFPAGRDCCRWVNLFGHLTFRDGRTYPNIVASFFVNYENRN